MNIFFKELNDEVLVVQEDIAVIDKDTIASLRAKALGTVRRRARICAHRSTNDAVHEMLIVHTAGLYVQPHKHPGKSESFHIIEGKLDIVVFDDVGNIKHIVNMGEYSSGYAFYWRLSESYFHTVIPRSEVVIFHESTSGPFDRSTCYVTADWAPKEDDHGGIDRFGSWLDRVILDHRNSKVIPEIVE